MKYDLSEKLMTEFAVNAKTYSYLRDENKDTNKNCDKKVYHKMKP